MKTLLKDFGKQFPAMLPGMVESLECVYRARRWIPPQQYSSKVSDTEYISLSILVVI